MWDEQFQRNIVASSATQLHLFPIGIDANISRNICELVTLLRMVSLYLFKSTSVRG